MKKKYLVIIVVAVLLVASSIFIGVKIFNSKDNKEIKDNKTNNSTQVSDPIIKPANNTEELLTSSKELENTKITKDKIEFDNSINIASGDKIAIWLYSAPKFLGWFEVKEENGTKYIDGLDKAIEKESIDSGSHHIAIANKDNETLGYVNVDINEDNNIEEIDAIKKLGIEQDFYSYTNFYQQVHIHFNKDYTFTIDNDGVSLKNSDYYFITDRIKFESGKYNLIEKDNSHIMLNLTFNYDNGKKEDVIVAMYEENYNGNTETFIRMEFSKSSFAGTRFWLSSDLSKDKIKVNWPTFKYVK